MDNEKENIWTELKNEWSSCNSCEKALAITVGILLLCAVAFVITVIVMIWNYNPSLWKVVGTEVVIAIVSGIIAGAVSDGC